MAIVLPDNKEDKKRAIEQLVRGKAATYTVGSKTYKVVPRKSTGYTMKRQHGKGSR